jgi:hypothetical protein
MATSLLYPQPQDQLGECITPKAPRRLQGFPEMLAAILQSIADFTRVKCDVNTPPAPPWQGWVQPETHPARRWGVGLSNGVSHSMENRYSSACPGK